MSKPSRPHIMAALVCQGVSNDPGGAVTIHGASTLLTRKEIRRAAVIPLGGLPDSIHLFVAVSFEEDGPHSIGLRFLDPEDQVLGDYPDAVTIEKGRIVSVPIPIGFWPIRRGGKHWIEVVGDGEFLTRVPVRIRVEWAS